MKFLVILVVVIFGASCMVSLIDNSLSHEWDAFKLEYNKNYASQDEELSRF